MACILSFYNQKICKLIFSLKVVNEIQKLGRSNNITTQAIRSGLGKKDKETNIDLNVFAWRHIFA